MRLAAAERSVAPYPSILLVGNLRELVGSRVGDGRW